MNKLRWVGIGMNMMDGVKGRTEIEKELKERGRGEKETKTGVTYFLKYKTDRQDRLKWCWC